MKKTCITFIVGLESRSDKPNPKKLKKVKTSMVEALSISKQSWDQYYLAADWAKQCKQVKVDEAGTKSKNQKVLKESNRLSDAVVFHEFIWKSLEIRHFGNIVVVNYRVPRAKMLHADKVVDHV